MTASPRVPSGGGEGQHEQDFGERIRARAESGEGRLWRKKPVVIEAVQLGAGNAEEIANWCAGSVVTDTNPDGSEPMSFVQIATLEGTMQASPGDWIIRGVQGEFYPCKPDIFAATYEPASTTPPEVAPSPSEDELQDVIDALECNCIEGGSTDPAHCAYCRCVATVGRLASATTKAGQEENWVERSHGPGERRVDLGGEQSSPSAEASNLSPEQMTAHSGVAYGDFLASEREHLDETERLCGLLSELADAAESGQWVTHPSDYKISRKRLDDAIAAARSTLNPSATRPKAAPKNVSPSGSLPDTARRLDFALAVIDDHDEEHPDPRLRADYEQRVEEEETEARGQAMEP